MSAVTLSPQDVTTLLLGLDPVESYAAGEMAQARRARNVAKAAAMQQMLEHVEDLRARLRTTR